MLEPLNEPLRSSKGLDDRRQQAQHTTSTLEARVVTPFLKREHIYRSGMERYVFAHFVDVIRAVCFDWWASPNVCYDNVFLYRVNTCSITPGLPTFS